MFHSNNPTLFGRPERIVAGAEALRSTILGLRRVSLSLLGAVPPSALEARGLLSDFSAQLSVYFGAEEHSDSGYYGTIGAGYPEVEGKVDGIERSHDELRDSVASIRRFARDGGEARELGHRIDGVVDGFERQEHEENELLQEFFLRDEGGRG